jgi:hypothetical protein
MATEIHYSFWCLLLTGASAGQPTIASAEESVQITNAAFKVLMKKEPDWTKEMILLVLQLLIAFSDIIRASSNEARFVLVVQSRAK